MTIEQIEKVARMLNAVAINIHAQSEIIKSLTLLLKEKSAILAEVLAAVDGDSDPNDGERAILPGKLVDKIKEALK